MACTEYVSLKAIKKQTLNFLLKFKKGSGKIDITGWVFYLTIKKNMGDSDENASLYRKIEEVDNPTQGLLPIKISSEEMDLEPGNYYIAIDYKDKEDENEGTLVTGRITIAPSVLNERD